MNRQCWAAVLLIAATLSTAPLAPSHAQKKPTAAQPKGKTAAKPEVKTARKKITRKQAQTLLHTGYRALQANNTKSAVAEFTTALNSGRLQRSEMAKAMYYRGRAYRALKQPANAISDLTSALWLKGALSKKERAEALKERKLAYTDAGVGVGSDSILAASEPQPSTPLAPLKGSKTKPVRTTAKTTWQTSTSQPQVPTTTGSTQSSASTASGTSVTSFFGSLFGTSPAAKPAVVTTNPKAGESALASSWSTGTRQTKTPVRRSSRASSKVAALASRPSSTGGEYVVQIASFRSSDQAKVLARQVAAKHASLLSGRKAAVEQQAVGNMGTFYHVRVRNWPTQKAPAPLCRKLLASGLDCLVTKP